MQCGSWKCTMTPHRGRVGSTSAIHDTPPTSLSCEHQKEVNVFDDCKDLRPHVQARAHHDQINRESFQLDKKSAFVAPSTTHDHLKMNRRGPENLSPLPQRSAAQPLNPKCPAVEKIYITEEQATSQEDPPPPPSSSLVALRQKYPRDM